MVVAQAVVVAQALLVERSRVQTSTRSWDLISFSIFQLCALDKPLEEVPRHWFKKSLPYSFVRCKLYISTERDVKKFMTLVSRRHNQHKSIFINIWFEAVNWNQQQGRKIQSGFKRYRASKDQRVTGRGGLGWALIEAFFLFSLRWSEVQETDL